MTFPARVSVVAIALTAAAGGYWLGRQNQTLSPSVPAAATSTDATELTRLREENRQLRAANETAAKTRALATDEPKSLARAGAPTEPTTGIARLKTIAEVQLGRLATVRLPLMERNGRLADGFVRLFEITPTEKELLQQALDQARARSAKLALANATVKVDGGTFVATIPPFEGGADVYDGVMDAFAHTLGPDRNGAFVALQTDQLSSALNGFGAEQRTITITREARPGSKYGETGIMVRDQRRSPSGGSSMTGMSTDTKQMLEQFPWLEPHLETINSLPVTSRSAAPAPPGR
jgi:hypothetical protein